MTTDTLFRRHRRGFLAATACALLTVSPHGVARAEGVRAGTVITNTATASYGSGDRATTVSSNTVTVTVDEILDVAVASLSPGPVPVTGGEQALPFTVTNAGNGPEAFALTAVSAIGGDEFDPSVLRLALDSDGNGIYDPSIDTILTGGVTPILDPDARITVFVIAAAPAGVADQQRGAIRLEARAVTGTGNPGTSFAGMGLGGGAAVVGATGADADATAMLVAARVSVALVKSASVADPFGGTSSVPGALITYRIVSTVTGTGTAPSLRIADTIPAGTDYLPGSLRFEDAALSDAADDDAGTASAAGVEVRVGDQPAGSSRAVQFTVKIK